MINSIPKEFIDKYLDQLEKAARSLNPGLMQDAVLKRAEAILDLVDAYKKSIR